MSFVFSPIFSVIAIELFLGIGAMALLLLGAFGRPTITNLINALTSALLILSILFLLYFNITGSAFHGAFIMDPFARLMKILILLSAFFVLVLSAGYGRLQGFYSYEYPILLLLSTLGMLLMVSSNDMITLYLGLELQSLSLYVLAAMDRDNLRSSESGLKYFVLGALSSGMLLYGISLIYGFTGHTGYVAIAQSMSDDISLGMIFGLVFVLAGLSFKISAVPFHMWTPDVYEGAPTSVTAFFASCAKIAAMSLLVRIVYSAFSPALFDWQQVIVFLSFSSMLLGSFAAIGQRNLKRLMAYSSIGHIGFALLGLASGSEFGVSSLITYMIIYAFMTLGIFACLVSLRTPDGMTEQIEDLSGLFSTNPIITLMLTILLFSLAGIPPLAGFWAKYFVFSSAIESGFYPLAIVGALSAVVAAFYYLRIIKVMWFDESHLSFVPMAIELRWILGISGIFAVGYVFFADFVSDLSISAASVFF